MTPPNTTPIDNPLNSIDPHYSHLIKLCREIQIKLQTQIPIPNYQAYCSMRTIVTGTNTNIVSRIRYEAGFIPLDPFSIHRKHEIYGGYSYHDMESAVSRYIAATVRGDSFIEPKDSDEFFRD